MGTKIHDLARQLIGSINDLRISRQQLRLLLGCQGYGEAVNQRDRVFCLQSRHRSHRGYSLQVLRDQRSQVRQNLVGFLPSMVPRRPVVNLDEVQPAHHRPFSFDHPLHDPGRRLLPVQPSKDSPGVEAAPHRLARLVAAVLEQAPGHAALGEAAAES